MMKSQIKNMISETGEVIIIPPEKPKENIKETISKFNQNKITINLNHYETNSMNFWGSNNNRKFILKGSLRDKYCLMGLKGRKSQ